MLSLIGWRARKPSPPKIVMLTEQKPMMIAYGVRFLSAGFVASAATALRISDDIEVMDNAICLKPDRNSVSRSD